MYLSSQVYIKFKLLSVKISYLASSFTSPNLRKKPYMGRPDRKKKSVLPETLSNELHFQTYPKIHQCRA